MRVSGVFPQAVQDKLIIEVLEYVDGFKPGIDDLLSGGGIDRLAAKQDDFANSLVLRRVDQIVRRDFIDEVGPHVRLINLHRLGLVECADQSRVRREIGVHCAEQRHRGEFSALIDSNQKFVVLIDNKFDPTSPFGNNSAGITFLLAWFRTQDKIDTGRTVQLTDDDAFGTIDNKFATPQHNRNITEVDFLFDRLLFDQPQPDTEGPAVGQAKLAALGCRVTRFSEFIAKVFEFVLPIVRFDGKNFPHNLFETFPLAFAGMTV